MGLLLPQRVQPQLGVIRLTTPGVLVLRAIVDQQQDGRRRHTLAQQLQPGLGLAIEPVQVFDQQQQGLVQAFAQQHPGDRLEGAAAAGVPSGPVGRGRGPSKASG